MLTFSDNVEVIYCIYCIKDLLKIPQNTFHIKYQYNLNIFKHNYLRKTILFFQELLTSIA